MAYGLSLAPSQPIRALGHGGGHGGGHDGGMAGAMAGAMAGGMEALERFTRLEEWPEQAWLQGKPALAAVAWLQGLLWP